MPKEQKQIIVVKCNSLKCTVSMRLDESQVFYRPVLGEPSNNIHGLKSYFTPNFQLKFQLSRTQIKVIRVSER